MVALVAQLDVPNNEPVNEVANTPPLTCKAPELGVVILIPMLLLFPETTPPPDPSLIEPIVASC